MIKAKTFVKLASQKFPAFGSGDVFSAKDVLEKDKPYFVKGLEEIKGQDGVYKVMVLCRTFTGHDVNVSVHGSSRNIGSKWMVVTSNEEFPPAIGQVVARRFIKIKFGKLRVQKVMSPDVGESLLHLYVDKYIKLDYSCFYKAEGEVLPFSDETKVEGFKSYRRDILAIRDLVPVDTESVVKDYTPVLNENVKEEATVGSEGNDRESSSVRFGSGDGSDGDDSDSSVGQDSGGEEIGIQGEDAVDGRRFFRFRRKSPVYESAEEKESAATYLNKRKASPKSWEAEGGFEFRGPGFGFRGYGKCSKSAKTEDQVDGVEEETETTVKFHLLSKYINFNRANHAIH